jgi:hypothetical protein
MLVVPLVVVPLFVDVVEGVVVGVVAAASGEGGLFMMLSWGLMVRFVLEF